MTEIAGTTCPTCAAALPAPGMSCPRCASPAPWSAPGAAHQSMPYQAPYPPMGGPGTPYPPMGYQPAPYQPAPYQPNPYQPGPYAVRPAKSPGVAVLLTLLWIGAGHLYLDRVGTGLALMAAHFFLGFLLFVIFFPLGFVAWLAAVVCACVWCSNLAGQINAGTVPPRQTW